jgi:hypothetical protein
MRVALCHLSFNLGSVPNPAEQAFCHSLRRFVESNTGPSRGSFFSMARWHIAGGTLRASPFFVCSPSGRISASLDSPCYHTVCFASPSRTPQ